MIFDVSTVKCQCQMSNVGGDGYGYVPGRDGNGMAHCGPDDSPRGGLWDVGWERIGTFVRKRGFCFELELVGEVAWMCVHALISTKYKANERSLNEFKPTEGEEANGQRGEALGRILSQAEQGATCTAGHKRSRRSRHARGYIKMSKAQRGVFGRFTSL